MATPEGRPDVGPARPHLTAGATVVGARPILIAWNIQLDTRDIAVASRIARRIRERDGGLPSVQALGFPLAAEGVAQVSMNVLDHRTSHVPSGSPSAIRSSSACSRVEPSRTWPITPASM
jgi:glutamate formiminotransferase